MGTVFAARRLQPFSRFVCSYSRFQSLELSKSDRAGARGPLFWCWGAVLGVLGGRSESGSSGKAGAGHMDRLRLGAEFADYVLFLDKARLMLDSVTIYRVNDETFVATGPIPPSCINGGNCGGAGAAGPGQITMFIITTAYDHYHIIIIMIMMFIIITISIIVLLVLVSLSLLLSS